MAGDKYYHSAPGSTYSGQVPITEGGGIGRNRTDYLLHTVQALSQLSYNPDQREGVQALLTIPPNISWNKGGRASPFRFSRVALRL